MKVGTGRWLLAASVVVIVGAAAIYVVRTTDAPSVRVSFAAQDAFGPGGSLAPEIERAAFSPDGLKLAVKAAGDVGLAHGGRFQRLTALGSNVADFAWMPASESLLVGEGGEIRELDVIDLKGDVTGVAKLDRGLQIDRGGGAIAVDRRGARAVVATATTEVLGGRVHLDLVIVDLPTGQVTTLADTPNDEFAPVFTDDDHVAFSRVDTNRRQRVVLRDLTTGTERAVDSASLVAYPVGIAGEALVYASTSRMRTDVRARLANGRTQALGKLPAASRVWSVDPSGYKAVATVTNTLADGEKTSSLRAVSLSPPRPG